MKLFVCHASEDKKDFLDNLVDHLSDVELFYDKYSLTIGDDISQVILNEISNSKGSIVVFSESFLRKPYPQNEFSVILGKKLSEHDYKILPIYLDIDEKTVLKKYPTLANIWHEKGKRQKKSSIQVADSILKALGINKISSAPNVTQINYIKLKSTLDQLKDFNEILSKRYGIGSSPRTLEFIGSELNLTRERIRQRETKAKMRLKQILETSKDFKEVKEVISQSIENIEGGYQLISLKKLHARIKSVSDNEYNFRQFIKMCLDLIGFKEIINNYDFNVIFIKETNDLLRKEIENEVNACLFYLKSKCSIPISIRSIKKSIGLSFPDELIKYFLENSEIIHNSAENYLINYKHLGSYASIAERILFEKRKPIHSSNLFNQVNEIVLNQQFGRGNFSKRLLIQQMSTENTRFAKNRKGFWTLYMWKRNVVGDFEILKEVLKASNTPMQIEPILMELKKINVPDKSLKNIKTYLSSNREIIRLYDNHQNLYFTTKGIKIDENTFHSYQPIKKTRKIRSTPKQNKANQHIKEYFKIANTNSVKRKVLAEYLKKKLKLNSINLSYGYIKKSQLIDSQSSLRNGLAELIRK
jgi:hypothetical protein